MWLFMCWQYKCLFYLSPSARYSQSKCPWPWPWPLEWSKVKCKYAKRKGATFCLFAIAMIVLFFAICEIIMYELFNVLDSNLWPLKWRSRTFDDSDENWQKDGPCQRAYVCKNGCFFKSSCLFMIHNRTFHEGRKDKWTNTHFLPV